MHEMSGQFVSIATNQTRSEIAEPPGAHLAHLGRIAVLANETDHLLNRNSGRSGGGGQLSQPVDVVGRDVPPIRVSANKFHHPPTCPAEDQRYRMRGKRRLAASGVLTASPVLVDQVEMTFELPGHRILLTDIESGEFRGPGPGAEAEFEPAV